MSCLSRLTRQHAVASEFLKHDGIEKLLALRIPRFTDARTSQWPHALTVIPHSPPLSSFPSNLLWGVNHFLIYVLCGVVCAQAIFRNCVEEPSILLAAFEHDIKLALSQQPVPSAPPSKPAKEVALDPQYDKYCMETTKFVRWIVCAVCWVVLCAVCWRRQHVPVPVPLHACM